MRRLIFFGLIIGLIIMMGGCKSDIQPAPKDMYRYNYNNVAANNSNFWLSENTLYYRRDTLLSSGYYMTAATGNKEIVSIDSGSPWKILEYENTLYLLDNLSPGVFRLHYYNMATGTDKSLGTLTGVYKYFVIGQYLYYLQEADNGVEWIQSLWVCSLIDGTKKQIEYSVLGAGVIDDVPVYLTRDNENFSLHRYVAEKDIIELWAEFSFKLSAEEVIEEYINFTSQRIVLTVSDEITTKLVCYELNSGTLSTYSIEGWVSSVIAYEKYAFIVLTETNSNEVRNWNNTIYQIGLETGSMKKLGQIRGSLNTFVRSDDAVYVVSSRNERTVYRYDASGHKTIAYRVY